MFRRAVLLAVIAALATGCGNGPKSTAANAMVAADPAVQRLSISPEDLYIVQSASLALGPLITGSVQPARRADLRAEVSAVVLQVLKENGDAVRRGDLLVRLDDSAIREGLASAGAAERAAEQAYTQAERQFQRMQQLRESGLVSVQSLEDVEIRRNTTQSELEAARSRVAAARQQLQRTEARAPFDGIVSNRKVSAGDTAQVGKELLQVMDPDSMRFEGLVSAEAIGEVQVGQPVLFRIYGYGQQEFMGKVSQVNPAADSATRQVEVLVELAGGRQPAVAGLYAEGRIAASSVVTLTVPASAVVKDGEQAFAWRVQDDEIRKVAVALGERNALSGEFAVTGGLAEGERLLRYPAATLHDGQRVELTEAK